MSEALSSQPPPSSAGEQDPGAPHSEKSVTELAWAEWELIQKKIETVSNFPFTVKAWSVAVSGFLLGLGKGFDYSSRTLWVILLVPIIFKAIESKHNAIRDTLGKRAEVLERLLARLVPMSEQLPKSIPYTLRRQVSRLPGVALSLISAKKVLARERIQWQRRPGERRGKWAYRNARTTWHRFVVPHGDLLFYVFQLTLIGLAISRMGTSANGGAGSFTVTGSLSPVSVSIPVSPPVASGSATATVVLMSSPTLTFTPVTPSVVPPRALAANLATPAQPVVTPTTTPLPSSTP